MSNLPLLKFKNYSISWATFSFRKTSRFSQVICPLKKDLFSWPTFPLKKLIYFHRRPTLSIHQNLVRFHWGFFSKKNKKNLCNALRLHDMHVSLPGLKFRPIIIRCFCLLSKAILPFLIHWLIWVYRMPVLYSNASVMPILDCLRWSLLSLFIKPDHAPCGVVWFIIKEFTKQYCFGFSQNYPFVNCMRSINNHLVLTSS